MRGRTGWAVLIAANVVFLCVLSLYRSTSAASQAAKQPFANAVAQRMEMITQLREARALLKEQNALVKEQNTLANQQNELLKEQIALLRSGKLEVVVSSTEKR